MERVSFNVFFFTIAQEDYQLALLRTGRNSLFDQTLRVRFTFVILAVNGKPVSFSAIEFATITRQNDAQLGNCLFKGEDMPQSGFTSYRFTRDIGYGEDIARHDHVWIRPFLSRNRRYRRDCRWFDSR